MWPNMLAFVVSVEIKTIILSPLETVYIVGVKVKNQKFQKVSLTSIALVKSVKSFGSQNMNKLLGASIKFLLPKISRPKENSKTL